MEKENIAQIIKIINKQAQIKKDTDDGIPKIASKIVNSIEYEEIINLLIDELVSNSYELKYYTLPILQEIGNLDQKHYKNLISYYNLSTKNEDAFFIKSYIITLLLLKIKDSEEILLNYINNGFVDDFKFYLLVQYHNINSENASKLLAKYITKNEKFFVIPENENAYNHGLTYLLEYFKNDLELLLELLENLNQINKQKLNHFKSIVKNHLQKIIKIDSKNKQLLNLYEIL